jgi:transposase-like protein
LPAYARRSPKVTDVLPILYLRGLSTGDFQPALRDLLGVDAWGLSASSISRLTELWQADHAAFRARSLRFQRYAYLFVDGVVRHEALLDRAGCKTPPLGCRSSPVKLRAA